MERKRFKRQKGQIYFHNHRIQALETINKNGSIGNNNRSNDNTKGNALGPFEKTNRKPGGELEANRWRIGCELVANWWPVGVELVANCDTIRHLGGASKNIFVKESLHRQFGGGELVANWLRIGS